MSDVLAVNGGKKMVGPGTLTAWPPRTPAIREQLLRAYDGGDWTYAPENMQDRLATEFAQAHGAEYGLFLTNATTALLGALIALGVTAGDEVIVPAFTCPTTVLPILLLGATPVFADCERDTLCIATDEVLNRLSQQTKAIIAVHMYTAVADVDALTDVARRRNVALIEDCAHLPGAKWNGKAVGSFGQFGCFSFHGKKTITSGEGGMIVTNDRALFDRVHRFVHVGKPHDFEIDAAAELTFMKSVNAAASTFQASVVLAQLRELEATLAGYRASYRCLCDRVAESGATRVQSVGSKTSTQSFFKICLIFDQGPLADVPLDAVIEASRAEGLPLKRTYGAAYHDPRLRQQMRAQGWEEGRCPVAETVATERTAVLDHWWLSGGERGAAFIAAVLNRLAALAHTIPAPQAGRTKQLFSRPRTTIA